jgi:hypothetical protein
LEDKLMFYSTRSDSDRYEFYPSEPDNFEMCFEEAAHNYYHVQGLWSTEWEDIMLFHTDVHDEKPFARAMVREELEPRFIVDMDYTPDEDEDGDGDEY